MKLLAAFAVPPVLATFAWLSPPPMAPVPASEPKPPLALRTHAVVYPEVDARAVVPAQFPFYNRTEGPVQIVRVEPSCGCVRPRINDLPIGETKTFGPGEIGALNLALPTANEDPGEHAYSVLLVTKDEADREFRQTVHFRVTLPTEKVTVEPREVYFYQLQGEAGEHAVFIRDGRGTPLTATDVQVVDAKTSSPGGPISEFLTARLVSLKEAEEVRTRRAEQNGRDAEPAPEDAVAAVRIDVRDGLPPGRRVGWVRITTDDPAQPVLQTVVLLDRPAEK